MLNQNIYSYECAFNVGRDIQKHNASYELRN